MRYFLCKRSLIVWTAFVIGFFVSISPAIAELPEPKSDGKFLESKGTKASEQYEEQGRAGNPMYEYGAGLQVGPFHLKPQIEFNHEWDNNIFLDENGRKEDHINRLEAGVDVELPLMGGQHLLKAFYKTLIEWFERYSNQDHTDHHAGVGLELNFVPFSLAVDEGFKRTVDRSGTEFTQRVEREENTVRGLLEIPFSTFFLETEVYDLNVEYLQAQNEVFDHHDFTIFQRVGYDINPDLQVLAEYGYKNIHYFNVDDREGDAHQVAFGVRGHLTERISYQAWAGGQFRIYDVDSEPDFQGFIARGAVRYDISETSNLTIRLDRSPQESTFDNQHFYVRNRIELGWRQRITDRIYFNGSQDLQYNEYSRITALNGTERTRRDYVWETVLGLEYVMPNDIVTIFGEYHFRSRESNTALLDYDGQVIMAGIRASF